MIENVLSIDIKIWKISEFREWLIAKNKNQKTCYNCKFPFRFRFGPSPIDVKCNVRYRVPTVDVSRVSYFV